MRQYQLLPMSIHDMKMMGEMNLPVQPNANMQPEMTTLGNKKRAKGRQKYWKYVVLSSGKYTQSFNF
jgi:hypothetical protein